MAEVDVLIPTYNRPAHLAVTLTSLCFQEYREFDVIIADQSDEALTEDSESLAAAVRLLRQRGSSVFIDSNLPRRGLAQQRQFLLDRAQSPYCLFLDDDVILEPYVIGSMLRAIREEKCGFVGQALIGLSFVKDYRPHQQTVEFWQGKVTPEEITPNGDKWQRHLLHNAANVLHLQRRIKVTPDTPKKYKVAWVGGCVMYDTDKLRNCGGFSFWQELPKKHVGEDVLAQLRVMKKFGGCGLLPSGAYHQEAPTTVPDREIDAPKVLHL